MKKETIFIQNRSFEKNVIMILQSYRQKKVLFELLESSSRDLLNNW